MVHMITHKHDSGETTCAMLKYIKRAKPLNNMFVHTKPTLVRTCTTHITFNIISAAANVLAMTMALAMMVMTAMPKIVIL